MSGLTVSGGSADKGGGLQRRRNPGLDSTVSGNSACGYSGGGGVYCNGGETSLSGCTISGNTATSGRRPSLPVGARCR